LVGRAIRNLHSAAEGEFVSTAIPGPDGFLLNDDDPLVDVQHRLNDYLFSEEQREAAGVKFDVRPWRKLRPPEIVRHVEAILERLRWLDQHDSELEGAHLARQRLATLLRTFHTIKASYGETELCRLLDLTTALLGRIEPYGPVERVVKYLETHDLSPELTGALRDFQANIRVEMSINQAGLQSLRQTLHVLLWLDEWDPMDPARCWSECVRRDFRAMSGEQRAKWRALLKHIRGNAPVRMPKGWASQARLLVSAVGLDDVRAQVFTWFTPFRSGQPLSLSVAGSHVLKGLIWYCAVAEDAELEICARWLLDARWKQKRNIEKALGALAVLGVTKAQLVERGLISPPEAPRARLLVEALSRASVLPGEHIHVDGQHLIVQGQMHFYRVSRTTGEIQRVTDGATLELNWPAIPDQMRSTLHRECDSEHQVALRACLLVHDGAFAKWFLP
jgi:hypothetical protein